MGACLSCQEGGSRHQEQHNSVRQDPSAKGHLAPSSPGEAAAVKLCGIASTGGHPVSPLSCRLVVAQGHVLASAFEAHISVHAAEYCHSRCWDAFTAALGDGQLEPAVATLQALGNGFLSSPEVPLDARLTSGCSATLVHVDLTRRTVTVASLGAHGAVAVGSRAASAIGNPSSEGSVNGTRPGVSGHQAGPRPEAACSGLGPLASKGPQACGGMAMRYGSAASCAVLPGGVMVHSLASPLAESRLALSRLMDRILLAASSRADAAGGDSPQPAAQQRYGVAMPAPAAPLHQEPLRKGASGSADVSWPRVLSAPVYTACAPGPAAGAAAAPVAVGHGHSSSLASACQRLVPQAIGFGCAKDGAQLGLACTQAEMVTAGQSTSTTGSGGVAHGWARFLQKLGKPVCGCEVQSTTRPLVPGDDCVLLLAGSGAGDMGGLGACRRGRGDALAESGSSSSGGASGSVGARLRRESASVGRRSSSSNLGVVACSCGPAGALSLADAVALAAAVDADACMQAPAQECSTASSGNSLLEVLYDSLHATAAGGADTLSPAATTTGCVCTPAGGARAQCGSRAAPVVASYASAAAAARNALSDGPAAGRPEDSSLAASMHLHSPGPASACVVLWLNWRAASSVQPPSPPLLATSPPLCPGGTTASLPACRSPDVRRRWQLVRSYCRFRTARRQRILSTWHELAAQLLAARGRRRPSAAVTSPGQSISLASGMASLEIPSSSGLVSGGGIHNVFPRGPGTGETTPVAHTRAGACILSGSGSALRWAGQPVSFTSRPPLMMEFVEAEGSRPTAAAAVTASGVWPASAGAPRAAGTPHHAVGGDDGFDVAALGITPVLAGNGGGGSVEEDPFAARMMPFGGMVLASVEDYSNDQNAFVDLSAAASGVGVNQGSELPSGQQLSTQQHAYSHSHAHAQHSAGVSSSGLATHPSFLTSVPGPGLSPFTSSCVTGQGFSGSVASRPAPAPSSHGGIPSHSRSSPTFELSTGTFSFSSRVPLVPALMAGSASVGAEARPAGAAGTCTSACTLSSGAGGGSSAATGAYRSSVATGSSVPTASIDWSLVMASDNSLSSVVMGAKPLSLPLSSAQSSGVFLGVQLPAAGAASLAPGPPSLPSRPPAPTVPSGAPGQTRALSPRHPGAFPAWPGLQSSTGVVALDGLNAPPSHAAVAAAGGGAPESMGPEDAATTGSWAHADLLQGVLLMGRSSSGDTDDASGELPPLCIQSTAELTALMAEIIISDDGEVVRTGGRAGGRAGVPYGLRAGLAGGGLGAGAGRLPSRQGSRGWTPRLAAVREDVREAATSSSTEPLALAEMRLSAISEGKGTSPGSSNTSANNSSTNNVLSALEQIPASQTPPPPLALSPACVAAVAATALTIDAIATVGSLAAPNCGRSFQAVPATGGLSTEPTELHPALEEVNQWEAGTDVVPYAGHVRLQALQQPIASTAADFEGLPAEGVAAPTNPHLEGVRPAAAFAQLADGVHAVLFTSEQHPHLQFAPRSPLDVVDAAAAGTPPPAAAAAAAVGRDIPVAWERGGAAAAATTAAALADVLEDLSPSLDRLRVRGEASITGPASAQQSGRLSTQLSGGWPGSTSGRLSQAGVSVLPIGTMGNRVGGNASPSPPLSVRHLDLAAAAAATAAAVNRTGLSPSRREREEEAAVAGGGGGKRSSPQGPGRQHGMGHLNSLASAGTAGSDTAASVAVVAAAAAVQQHGWEAATTGTVERAWSVGSGPSGALCSVLHTTWGKSSMTGGATTAGTTSSQGSPSLAPSLHGGGAASQHYSPQAGQQHVASPVLSQSSGMAASLAAAGPVPSVVLQPSTAPTLAARQLPRSLSAACAASPGSLSHSSTYMAVHTGNNGQQQAQLPQWRRVVAAHQTEGDSGSNSDTRRVQAAVQVKACGAAMDACASPVSATPGDPGTRLWSRGAAHTNMAPFGASPGAAAARLEVAARNDGMDTEGTCAGMDGTLLSPPGAVCEALCAEHPGVALTPSAVVAAEGGNYGGPPSLQQPDTPPLGIDDIGVLLSGGGSSSCPASAARTPLSTACYIDSGSRANMHLDSLTSTGVAFNTGGDATRVDSGCDPRYALGGLAAMAAKLGGSSAPSPHASASVAHTVAAVASLPSMVVPPPARAGPSAMGALDAPVPPSLLSTAATSVPEDDLLLRTGPAQEGVAALLTAPDSELYDTAVPASAASGPVNGLGGAAPAAVALRGHSAAMARSDASLGASSWTYSMRTEGTVYSDSTPRAGSAARAGSSARLGSAACGVEQHYGIMMLADSSTSGRLACDAAAPAAAGGSPRVQPPAPSAGTCVSVGGGAGRRPSTGWLNSAHLAVGQGPIPGLAPGMVLHGTAAYAPPFTPSSVAATPRHLCQQQPAHQADSGSSSPALLWPHVPRGAGSTAMSGGVGTLDMGSGTAEGGGVDPHGRYHPRGGGSSRTAGTGRRSCLGADVQHGAPLLGAGAGSGGSGGGGAASLRVPWEVQEGAGELGGDVRQQR